MKTLANEIVRVRINDQLKNDAKAVLESLGLTMSEAVRIFLKRVVDEKALPFVLRMPAHLDISQMSKSKILKQDAFVQQKRFFPILNAERQNEFQKAMEELRVLTAEGLSLLKTYLWSFKKP